MGSGGALTLWPPSNEAGAFAGLIDVLFRAGFWLAYRPPDDPAGAGLSLTVGFIKHEQSY